MPMTRITALLPAPALVLAALALPALGRALRPLAARDAAWREATLAKIPLGRFGDLGDLAGAAVFLASDASAYVTGHCLAVDGGMLAAL